MINKVFEFDGLTMALIKVSDINNYYKDGFEILHEEANYYTASSHGYTKEDISKYVHKITKDHSRYDFIIRREKEIIGEVVLNNIKDKKAHFRICLFKKENFSKGIGYKATKTILKFAFEDLALETIELEVYPFNHRGIALYEKLGFKIIEELFDAHEKEPYKKILKMVLNP